MAPGIWKLKDPLGLLLLLSIVLLVDLCRSDDSKVRCSVAVDDALVTICVNGFNTKNLGGPLRRRRQAGLFLPPHILPNQFVQLDAIVHARGKRKLSSRWRRRHQITGKRMRRNLTVKTGVVDECCKNGCTYSQIGFYCRRLAEARN
ncbi:uncharacterized protein LOC128861295 [Anastrepha ludens]|uniref:uncharacterized protein LOC128861295 n=1 Tax=Anastrepha ludens TaxID=28586 RepID=UPI0023B00A9C|nr:uncharacterized protein LOC128861295 [Anastrepha ludens]